MSFNIYCSVQQKRNFQHILQHCTVKNTVRIRKITVCAVNHKFYHPFSENYNVLDYFFPRAG